MGKNKKVSRRTAFEYRDDRGRDLLEVFNQELGKHDHELVEDVVRRTVNRPARRFWVSEERAMRVVSEMQRKPLSTRCHPLKREMYEEINRRSQAVGRKHPKWPLSRCVFWVVNQPAPKFFLSVSSAHAIILEERKRCAKENMRRLRHLLSE